MIEELHGTKEIVHHPLFNEFRLYINTEEDSYPLHWHSDVEIIMPLENVYTVVLENEEIVLSEGDILIIPSGQMHAIKSEPEGKRIILLVKHSMIKQLNGFDVAFLRFFPYALFRKKSDFAGNENLRKILQQIADEREKEEFLYETHMQALIFMFFATAGRINWSGKGEKIDVPAPKRQQYSDRFFEICNYINEHCTEELSMDDMVSFSGFSKSHFIRLFKEYTGENFYEYLQKRRMSQAELLLLDTEEGVAEIAEKSGYNSLATFNRVFKDVHACTPTEYRKKRWGKKNP